MRNENPWITTEELPNDLVIAKKMLFDHTNFKISQPVPEIESTEYGACIFELNELNIRFRTAKITPTKTGQFVTLWKRINNGPIQPFESSDSIDLFIISTRKENHFGQFVFPMSILIEKGIVSHKDKEGKRAIRVYPPWDATTSNQAQRTQKWQLDFFLEISKNKPLDMARVSLLYHPELHI